MIAELQTAIMNLLVGCAWILGGAVVLFLFYHIARALKGGR